MGIQQIEDVTLTRHPYIRTARRNQGIGRRLLAALQTQTTCQLVVGTWADATWAIRFYENQGFQVVSSTEKDRLLKKYWSIPDRQVEVSVVLVN
jgi:GNAT superfamily N-acetyltransferase